MVTQLWGWFFWRVLSPGTDPMIQEGKLRWSEKMKLQENIVLNDLM